MNFGKDEGVSEMPNMRYVAVKVSNIGHWSDIEYLQKLGMASYFAIFNGNLTSKGLPGLAATRKTVCGRGSS